MLCFNDLAAATLARRAEERGCQVPGDLSVISYGDEVSARLPVPLTAIAPPKLEIGRLAAACLIERMQDPTLPARHVLIEPELIVRRSTTPPTGA